MRVKITMGLQYTGQAITDVGKVRTRNEDSYLVDNELGLYMVADGMGGHAGGDQASQTAVAEIKNAINGDIQENGNATASSESGSRTEAESRLINAVKIANEKIHDRSQIDESVRGMGTTITALLVHDNVATIGHVGDSRAYILRDGKLSQITEDHSWVNEQVKAGLLKPEDAKNHPYKNVITRSLGHERGVYVDVMSLDMQPGDKYFICSDGLSNLVDDAEVQSIVANNETNDALESLVSLANSRGGHDNITMVILSVGAETS